MTVNLENTREIAIVGAGSWATAIVKILLENPSVEKIHWWMRKKEVVEFFNNFGHNPNYLSSVLFDKSRIVAYDKVEECINACSFVILATPSAFLHQSISHIPASTWRGKTVVTAIKGLVPEFTQIVSDYMHAQCAIPMSHIACISGPCHAEEVARERLSYLTMASESAELTNNLAALFDCRFINTSTSTDIQGIEYAAILKNIYAIAAGVSNGLGYGDNFRAVLISYSIREMENFLKQMGLPSDKVNQSAYLGDLLVTAYSQFSRNRNFGNMLGRGYSVKSAQMEMNMVAEGYYSTNQIYILNEKIGAKMPILDCMYSIIYQNQSPNKAFKILEEQIF